MSFHVCVGLCATTEQAKLAKQHTKLVSDKEYPSGTAIKWDAHIQSLIDDGTIKEEGVYITWVWEYAICLHCKKHTGAVNVGINQLYTVRKKSNGQLISSAGAPSLHESTGRLTTWPPK